MLKDQIKKDLFHFSGDQETTLWSKIQFKNKSKVNRSIYLFSDTIWIENYFCIVWSNTKSVQYHIDNMLFMVDNGVFVHFDAFTTHARLFIFYCIRKIRKCFLLYKSERGSRNQKTTWYVLLELKPLLSNMNFHDFSWFSRK